MIIWLNVPWLAWLERLGGLGLVLLGLADNSLFPLPGSMDAATIILSARQPAWWPYYAAMATAGALAGGYATYALGREGGEAALEKKLSRKKADKIYRTFNKHGVWALFVPALLPPPVPFTPFVVAAGAMRYSQKKFLVVVGVARALRYSAAGYFGSFYGRAILGFLEKYYQLILWTFVAAAIVGGLAGGVYAWRRIHRNRNATPDIQKPHVQNKEDESVRAA